MSEGENPAHPPVEGPETPLDEARRPAHVDLADLEARLAQAQTRAEEADKRAAALEAKEKETLDRLARLQADFENFRRRSREETAQAQGRGKETLLKALLPLLDNLDRALAYSEDAGLKMIHRQLTETLTSQGVTVLDPAGQAFDAKLHEAVAEDQKDGVPAGTVLQVAEKGYSLDGRVLRPARVVVAK